MLRSFVFLSLLSTAAFAADVRFNVNFGNWRVGHVRQSRAVVPHYPVQAYPSWYWVVYPAPAPPPPAPPPQVIYVEREREPLPPPPQIVVVQLPPVEAPPPVVAAPEPPPVAVAPAPVVPVGPRVPGPDVFLWTDEDGVVNYSTRVPADARKRAKKLSSLAK